MNISPDRIEAVLKKLGGAEGVDRFLRGEITITEPVRRFREENGVIYFSVISDGATGGEWIERLETKKFRVSDNAKSVLCSRDFKPTRGVKYEIAVIRATLFKDEDRTTKKIRAEAEKRKLTTPNVEIACLIRENFSNEEIEVMGFWWIVAMHEVINDSNGDPRLLRASRYDDVQWLNGFCDRPDRRWSAECGLAFVVSQVSSQS